MCTFSEAIQMLSESPTAHSSDTSTQEKLEILAKMMNELKANFSKEEEIINYLPLNNANNTAITTTGWQGLSYVTKPLSIKYTQIFEDVRGNRVLVFTNKRMILVFPSDFFEEGHFSSYFYQDIRGIMLRGEKPSLLSRILKKKKEVTWYGLDFQGSSGIFYDTLQPFQKAQFLQILASIPAASRIPIGKRLIRNNKFDQIVNNFEYDYRVANFFNLLWILLGVLVAVGAIVGIGPFHGIHDFIMDLRKH